jgi:hypothetical protein
MKSGHCERLPLAAIASALRAFRMGYDAQDGRDHLREAPACVCLLAGVERREQRGT